ncbi:MAG: DUF3267 domain-containing protein [Xanthomonadales bacterium]|nr:DUF3267 domain-containing protein [Xanthomonadales bacterium]
MDARLIVFGLPYYFFWLRGEINSANIKHIAGTMNFGYIGISIFILLIVGIILHELIHGLTWARFAKKGFRSIKFGVLWEMLTPYCHCTEPLKVKHYIIGALAPAIILGFIPAIIAMIIGSIGLLVFGIFFIMAATGDFVIINLIKKENMNDLIQDHSSEAGCYIYRKIG